jgi:hypothetical protein
MCSHTTSSASWRSWALWVDDAKDAGLRRGLHQAGCTGGEPERFWNSSMKLHILTSLKVLQPYSGLNSRQWA